MSRFATVHVHPEQAVPAGSPCAPVPVYGIHPREDVPKGTEMSQSYPPAGDPQQPVQPPASVPVGAPTPMTDAEVRQWAGLAHLGGILSWLPPLIIWLVYKDRSAFVAAEAKKSLNFQLTLLIGWIAIFVIDIAFLGSFLSGLVRLALWVVAIVFCVQGYQAVNRGQAYKYPFSLELVK